MKRSTLLAGFACTAALALAGCATGPVAAVSKVEVCEATLSGTQEVPPNNATATGSAEVRFNEATSMLSWRVSFTGLSGPATGGHIHGPAAPGANAGVVVPFGNLVAQPITGEAKITAEQANQLKSGQWYVNIHSQRFPGGEIRGQLRPKP